MAQVACKNVFIVDDDSGIREMLSETLQDEGYRVISAGNGLEALNELRAHAEPPCLILLDLNMPVMTGWEFRSVQQQDPALAQIPVAIISADRGVQHNISTLAAVDYLTKPIDFNRLMSLLDQYCAD